MTATEQAEELHQLMTEDEAVRQRLAAAIADAETQHKHFADRRVHLWSVAREHGWTFDAIAAAAGVHRTAVFAALKRSGRLVPTRAKGDDGGA